MACNQSGECIHYNAWWCDRRDGCGDFEAKAKKSEPVITPVKEAAPEAPKENKRKKAVK